MASVARLETRLYMGSQLLRDIDAMSMAHSLEVRVPFVDHELLGAVWPAVGRHRRLLRNKRLLCQALPQQLPDEIVSRPKQGFLLPFESWLKSDLAEPVRSGAQALSDDGWIAPGAADRIWRAWRAGRSHWSRPWALGVLGRFLRSASSA